MKSLFLFQNKLILILILCNVEVLNKLAFGLSTFGSASFTFCCFSFFIVCISKYMGSGWVSVNVENTCTLRKLIICLVHSN